VMVIEVTAGRQMGESRTRPWKGLKGKKWRKDFPEGGLWTLVAGGVVRSAGMRLGGRGAHGGNVAEFAKKGGFVRWGFWGGERGRQFSEGVADYEVLRKGTQ